MGVWSENPRVRQGWDPQLSEKRLEFLQAVCKNVGDSLEMNLRYYRSAKKCWLQENVRVKNSRIGVPKLRDLMPDDLRRRWCDNDRKKVHNKCNAVEPSPAIPLPSPHHDLGKSCLPLNWSLVPKVLGIAGCSRTSDQTWGAFYNTPDTGLQLGWTLMELEFTGFEVHVPLGTTLILPYSDLKFSSALVVLSSALGLVILFFESSFNW